ncbi:type IV pilus assembly protein PilA [Halopseudomonas formosensis]|uniref:Pilin n=1 Tax=Halopseudomonas formosensis TaxID=1002526 RepID=A0A1I6C3J6_9GAMM|nr:pilin [Halopseudomonas formosensis]SFQ87773.1 type IV pilus assembly protein PilA [Halopseudomonas formosensis]
MKAQMQKGFTLIELMIVVAIIGILAAIALPAYQDYTGRAQASEALTLTAGVRADIAVQAAEQGGLSSVTVAGISSLKGKYVSKVETAGAGVITATFTGGVLDGETMTITPTLSTTGQIEKWVCSGSLEEKFIPSGCKN